MGVASGFCAVASSRFPLVSSWFQAATRAASAEHAATIRRSRRNGVFTRVWMGLAGEEVVDWARHVCLRSRDETHIGEPKCRRVNTEMVSNYRS